MLDLLLSKLPAKDPFEVQLYVPMQSTSIPFRRRRRRPGPRCAYMCSVLQAKTAFRFDTNAHRLRESISMVARSPFLLAPEMLPSMLDGKSTEKIYQLRG